uniref:Retrotransposon gag domain-containing protein n=1 Tax=Plectus sambesii TaxID=2011161 RepID=A0A914UHL0_9BILA
MARRAQPNGDITEDGATAATSRPLSASQRSTALPQPFQSTRESWTHYEERLEIHFELNGISDDRQKVLHLLAAVGSEVYAKVANMCAPVKPRDKPFDEVRAKLKAYFSSKRILLYERRAFYLRSQKEGESLAEYDNALRALADSCDFGVMLDDMLRDRFVLGLRSQEAITRIATEPIDAQHPLTYQRAIDIATSLEVANPPKQFNTIAQIDRRPSTRQAPGGRGKQ